MYYYEHVNGTLHRKIDTIVQMSGGPSVYFEGPYVKRWWHLPTLKRGDQIIYVPWHAGNDILDDHAEIGFVTSGPNNALAYFCRFWLPNHVGTELRTKANSEGAPDYCLYLVQEGDPRWLPPEIIQKALVEFC